MGIHLPDMLLSSAEMGKMPDRQEYFYIVTQDSLCVNQTEKTDEI